MSVLIQIGRLNTAIILQSSEPTHTRYGEAINCTQKMQSKSLPNFVAIQPLQFEEFKNLTPLEIAGLAVYLGSAESSRMTGQSIHVDGGMVLS
jgi:NAD(P)-dependent dehydrogenase (short-subunit alcohol dehydrogenase family)